MEAMPENIPMLMRTPARVRTAEINAEFQIENIYNLENYIFITGWSSALFNATVEGKPVKAVFDSSTNAAAAKIRFVLICETNLPLNMTFDFSGKKIKIKIPDIPIPLFNETSFPLLPDSFLDILNSLEIFSIAWHKMLIFGFRKNALPQLPNSNSVLNTAYALVQNMESSEASISIDNISNGILYGRLSGLNDNWSLFFNDMQLMTSNSSYSGDTPFSIKVASQKIGQWGVLSLVNNRTKKISAFRFIVRPVVFSDFILHLETLDKTISGWSINKSSPDSIYELEILIDGLPYSKIKNDKFRKDIYKNGISKGSGGFDFINPFLMLPAGSYELNFKFPDESLSQKIAAESTCVAINPVWNIDKLLNQVSIIIPVYNASSELADCLYHLFKYTQKYCRIIIIDDNSTEEKVSQILEEAAKRPQITIVRNSKNLGFSGSINKGIIEAGNDDVIILNSDTRVTPHWLEGILIAASSGNKIATVTPLSNNAGAFSAPEAGYKLPPGVMEETFARSFRRNSLALYPKVPTGNAFCMFINRQCINEIGLFDAQAFPRGYGEENDFCMRALRRGWSHIIDDTTYIFHERGRSFGNERKMLMEQGRQIINSRYPEYTEAIRIFSTSEKLKLARYCARKAAQAVKEDVNPSIIIISPTLSDTLRTQIKILFNEEENNKDCYFAEPGTYGISLFKWKKGTLIPMKYSPYSSPPGMERDEEICAISARLILSLDADEICLPETGILPESFTSLVKKLGRKLTILHEKKLRAFYWPDYKTTNPYQQLLYKGLEDLFDFRQAEMHEAAQYAESGYPVVYHLHWIAPILGTGISRAETESRIKDWLADARRFIKAGGSLIWTIHNSLSHEAPYPDLENQLRAEIATLASAIHVHSPKVPELLADSCPLPKEKLCIGAHGTFSEAYPKGPGLQAAREKLGIEPSKRVLLFLGQIRPYKGIMELVTTFKKLPPEIAATSVLIIAGQPVNLTPDELSQMKADNILLDLRRIPDSELGIYCDAADFMVLPYKNILTSGAAFLALGFNLPVLAPEIGILPEIILNNKNGFTWKPDIKEGLFATLVNALSMKSDDIKKLRMNSLTFPGADSWRSARLVIGRALATGLNAKFEFLEIGGEKCQILVRTPSDFKHERTGVIILHYNNLEDTIKSAACIRGKGSLYLVSNDEDIEAFIRLCQIFPEAIVIQSPANLGYAAGNNLALKKIMESGHDYILLMNPDVVPEDNFIKKMESALDKDEDVEIASPAILFGDRPDIVWYCGGLIDLENGFMASHLHIGESVSTLPAESFDVDYCTGAALFFRSSLLKKAGFLPEEYFLYFEETDWCLKVRKMGGLCRIYPDIRALHYKRSENAGLPTDTFLYYYSRNIFWITKKYYPDLLDKTEKNYRKKADLWLERIRNNSPERLEKAAEAIENGIKAGLTTEPLTQG